MADKFKNAASDLLAKLELAFEEKDEELILAQAMRESAADAYDDANEIVSKCSGLNCRCDINLSNKSKALRGRNG